MKVIKMLLIIFLVIIPVCLILYSMFIDFLGCYLLIENSDKIDSLLSKNGYKTDTKIVFLDTTAGDDEHITIINKDFSVKNVWTKDNELVDYIKTNGIDVYNTVNVINYVYIIIVACVILFKKILENVDKYGKFRERDN